MGGWALNPTYGKNIYQYVDKAAPGQTLRITPPNGTAYKDPTTGKTLIWMDKSPTSGVKNTSTKTSSNIGSPQGSYPGSSGGVMGSGTPYWVKGTVTGNKGAIQQIQAALNSLGYVGANGRPLVVDGIPGRNTQNAIRLFQTQHKGLDVNGLLTSATKLALYSDLGQKIKYKAPPPKAPGTDPGSSTDPLADIRNLINSSNNGVDVPASIDSTITPWKLTPESQLEAEARNAANSIYDPLIGGYRTALGNEQSQLISGRQTILGQAAQREANLKAILDASQSYMTQTQAASAQNQQNALAAIASLNQSAQQAEQGTYQQMAGSLADNLARMGIEAPAAGAGLAKQHDLASALLSSVAMSNQQSTNAQATQSNALQNILNTGIVNSNQAAVGQSNLARDRALNELASQISQQVADLGLKLSGTQSDKAAKFYELLKSLQSEDWKKYIDTSQISFNQGLSSAQLGQNAAKIAADVAQSKLQAELALKELEAKMNGTIGGNSSVGSTDPYSNALGYLRDADARLSPEMQQRYEYVLALLANPRGAIQTPFDSPFGDKNMFGDAYLGPAGDTKNRIDEYYARAWNSLNPQYKFSGVNDPNWGIMKAAIDRLFNLKTTVY